MDVVSEVVMSCGPCTVRLRPLRAGPEAKPIHHVPELPRLLDDPTAPTHAVQEWADYVALVEWRERRPDDEQVWVGDQLAPRLQTGGYLIRFENRVGRSEIRVVAAGVPVGEPLRLEVITPKLSIDPRDARQPYFYPRFLRALVEDLAAAAPAWPFADRSPTAFAAGLDEAPAGPLFHLHFLRRYGRDLATALRAVAARPHRVLAHEEAVIPAGRARRLDPQALGWLAAHPDAWQAVAPPAVGLALGDGHWAPERVLQALPRETHDNPENRFVRHFARLLGEAVRAVAGYKPSSPVYADAIPAVRAALSALERASWWSEVGPMTVLPTWSHVLLKVEGYRDLYRLYPLFLLARLPMSGILGEALANRDVAQLYEWWCLLRLLEELHVLCGAPAGEPELSSTEDGPPALTLRFADGTVLHYQPRCAGGRESYSLTLRPDFLVEHPRRGRVSLDAKFRFELSPAGVSGAEDADPERNPTHRDLMIMHAYRDALRCRAAVILYPGDVEVFYGVDGTWRGGAHLTTVLADDALAGVGAIPFRP